MEELLCQCCKETLYISDEILITAVVAFVLTIIVGLCIAVKS
jgi:hypothetical protein